MEIKLIFQNEHVIALEKPHGWLSTPSRDAHDPRPCVGRELEKQIGARVFPVHRLDFEVCGLMLWALRAEAHRTLQSWFETGSIQKIYQALSKPGAGTAPAEQDVEWRSHLVRGKRRAFEAGHGKLSLTRARVLETSVEKWLWELRPLTGRSHQLRYEMAKHGTPIWGDVLYGGPPLDQAGENRLALGAHELDMTKIDIADRFGLPERLQSSQSVNWDVRSL